MAKNVQLLLLESVHNLGIVGDVVKVKPGYARNYLLPHGLAEPPSPSKIEALKEARARAQAELAALREQQEKLVEQLQDTRIELERSCNDQGSLYGSVTQRDIADALMAAGYGVDPEAVRLAHPIRRIGPSAVPIQFDTDLRVEINVLVKPDHELEGYNVETGEFVEPEEAEPESDLQDEAERRKQRRKDREGIFAE